MKIIISVKKQILTLCCEGEIERTYMVSTSKFGTGSEPGSNKTPLGKFRICEKIGYRMPVYTCFKNRLPTGSYKVQTEATDLITSRILWLDGLDPDNANTRERYIYIHGTNHEQALGTPASYGCIRMANTDVIELYELVEQGTLVEIA